MLRALMRASSNTHFRRVSCVDRSARAAMACASSLARGGRAAMLLRRGAHASRASCGEGLLSFPGAWGDSGIVAAPWMPDESLCAADGKVCSEFMWAALDCPGYFAARDDYRVMLLGEIAAKVDRRVHASESCVVLGWRLGTECRKHRVAPSAYEHV